MAANALSTYNVPLFSQEERRGVLGEEGFRRYQHEHHMGLGHGVPSADVYAPATDAIARMPPPCQCQLSRHISTSTSRGRLYT
jgi:hypothetical protein